MDCMDKALPMIPDQANGTGVVTISFIDLTDLEDPPGLTEASRSSRTRQSLFSSIRRISQIVGPEQANKPNGSIVMSSVLCFIGLLAFGCVAVAYPLRPILITIGIVAFIILSSLVVLTVLDLKSNKLASYAYRRNLGNTILTICLAIPFFMLLYAFLWFPDLNKTVSRFSQDIVDEVQFPALALFQNSNWTSQANIRSKSMKCFLGWLKEDAVLCDDLPPEQLIPGQSCNCKAGWTNDVIEGFHWQNTTYRYLSWRPTPKLIDRVPAFLMTLQAFFTYNASQSLADSSATQSPSLWLAIYDPKLDLNDALRMGYTRMVLISANGNNAINLGLTYRQAPNFPPAYDYDLSLSSNQNLNLVCDTSPGKYIRPCHVTFFIQFPTFDRRVILQQPVMRWMDVAASAGAYFSFVQFVSWILSGQAMAT
ncbi:hypothetical protein ABVK25_007697 [Lepraria finkii]|uniref:Uncharacterized protein n=1 Tax=Lepraria finkii TaxID=1340010 RepID=A0ABR4B342_9LECA